MATVPSGSTSVTLTVGLGINLWSNTSVRLTGLSSTLGTAKSISAAIGLGANQITFTSDQAAG